MCKCHTKKFNLSTTKYSHIRRLFPQFRALYSTNQSATCSQVFPALCDGCKWLVRLIKRIWCVLTLVFIFPLLGSISSKLFFLFSWLSCYFISKLRWPFSPLVQDKLNRASKIRTNDLRSVLLSTPFMNGKNGSKSGGFMKRWLCNTSAITADTSWGDIHSGSSGACGSGIDRFERHSDSASSLQKTANRLRQADFQTNGNILQLISCLLDMEGLVYSKQEK